MPGGDRTGPNGMGPMTGRKAGFCTGNNKAGFAGGSGAGRGGGRRKGYRNMFFATGQPGLKRFNNPIISKKDEKQMLIDQAEGLKQELENISSRLDEVSKEE